MGYRTMNVRVTAAKVSFCGNLVRPDRVASACAGSPCRRRHAVSNVFHIDKMSANRPPRRPPSRCHRPMSGAAPVPATAHQSRISIAKVSFCGNLGQHFTRFSLRDMPENARQAHGGMRRQGSVAGLGKKPLAASLVAPW